MLQEVIEEGQRCKFAVGWPCQNRACDENVLWVKLCFRKAKETEVSQEFGNCMMLLNRGLTLEEIGDIWGVSRERVRQIEEKALSRIQEKALKLRDIEGIMDFMDLHGRECRRG